MTIETYERLDDRKLEEIEHSDRRRRIVAGYEYHTDGFKDLSRREFVRADNDYDYHFSNMKFYSITRSSFAYRDSLLFENIEGAVCLDYCCGNGEVGIEMAKRGAQRVVGIDISQVAVGNANHIALEEQVNESCSFKTMDAEKTEFADNTFDIIHEYGALHHLDLGAALTELARIVKPGGKVICTEAMRHNPLIHMYRKRTPHLRTKWEAEHILGVPEIMRGKNYFNGLTLRFFHLGALVAVPFRKMKIFPVLLWFLEGMDNVVLRIPYVRRMAWVAVYQYTDPIK